MLVLNLKRQLVMRGIKHGVSYLQHHGYTEAEARKLINGNLKLIRLTLLARLCETFKCSPNELFDWEGDPTHVLSEISKSEAPNILKLLEGKSPQELEEILRKLKEIG
ncbi:MAG: helix-turn-helix transcriptional regulator [Flavobacteriales bacterium]|nr:helix-turn-helix transcriptional regulator [Flavobacteriales bacterium]